MTDAERKADREQFDKRNEEIGKQRVCICMYVYVCMYISVCIYIYIVNRLIISIKDLESRGCIYVYDLYAYVCTCAYTFYVYMYMYMNIFIYMYIYFFIM